MDQDVNNTVDSEGVLTLLHQNIDDLDMSLLSSQQPATSTQTPYQSEEEVLASVEGGSLSLPDLQNLLEVIKEKCGEDDIMGDPTKMNKYLNAVNTINKHISQLSGGDKQLLVTPQKSGGTL